MTASDSHAVELSNALAIGQLLVDRDLRCLFANSRLLQWFGLSLESIQGRSFAEGFPSLVPRVARLLREVVGIGEAFSGMTIHEEGGNSSRGWIVGASPIFDQSRQVVRVAVTFSESLQAPYVEDEQKRSLFQAVFEEAAIGMTVIDWRDKGVRTNAAIRNMLGYSDEEMAQLGVQGISHPDDWAIDLQYFHRVMIGEIDRYEMVKRFFHKNGQIIWTNLMVSLTRDAQGQPSLIITMAQDISERKRVEQEREQLQAQLLHAQKLESLGVLAGGIAHDFNNFLSAILGSASLARQRLHTGDAAHADLDNVIGAAQRAASLTRQLVAYAGKGQFDVTVIDLSAQVCELATLLRTTISKRVELELDLANALPAIKVDTSQLQQVIMNLVINGAEAIADNSGRLRVATGVQDLDAQQIASLLADANVAPGRYVFLEVDDSGVGMDEATKARIFDPFFTTKFAGRGLGLAAVIGIVRSHGGAIQVYSNPGKGTTFRVYFPAVADKPKPVSTPAPDFRGSGIALVIDDDDGVRRAVKTMLEALGFAVLDASNGNAGVSLFASHAAECGVVILDMTMPGLSCEETFSQLRAIRDDVNVVLTSGYPEGEALKRFANKSVTGFIQKPFSLRELGQKLSQSL
jgi:PAS domain S-box-containing protein